MAVARFSHAVTAGDVICPVAPQAPPALLPAEDDCLTGKTIAAVACAVAAVGLAQQRHGLRRSEARRHARNLFGRVRLNGFRDDAASFGVSKKANAPGTLYELLKVRPDASQAEIKKAYYDMQKVCHPDVAGPDGEEVCILLNDAYDTLKDPKERRLYDARIKPEAADEMPIVKDLGPTWKWNPRFRRQSPKKQTQEPQWTGVPRSRSMWDKVPPESTGERHAMQSFVYVDEWRCVTCRNCFDIAPKTFCIGIDNNRARVYCQWGDAEEDIEAAIDSCPVSCISWVSRKELQALEHVTAVEMYRNGTDLPCPMTWRQGLSEGNGFDPFVQADNFEKRLLEQEEKASIKAQMALDKLSVRITEAMTRLSPRLRELAGW